MNDKQKSIIEQMVALEYAINSVLRDAGDEDVPVRIDFSGRGRYFHFSVDMSRLEPSPDTENVVQ